MSQAMQIDIILQFALNRLLVVKWYRKENANHVVN